MSGALAGGARCGNAFLRRFQLKRFCQRAIGVLADQQLAHELDRQVGVLQRGLADLRPELDLLRNRAPLRTGDTLRGDVDVVIDTDCGAHGISFICSNLRQF